MKTIENQINNFSKNLLKDTFLQKITKESIRIELCASILEGYTKRKKRKQTQKQFAESKKISISSVKRIELRKCYNLKLIDRYSV